jgi:hypothetical protein
MSLHARTLSLLFMAAADAECMCICTDELHVCKERDSKVAGKIDPNAKSCLVCLSLTMSPAFGISWEPHHQQRRRRRAIVHARSPPRDADRAASLFFFLFLILIAPRWPIISS